MEFDKNKVLTCVTADQAMVGQKGWFGETLSVLEKRVEKEPPKVLERVWLSGEDRYIFRTNNEGWSLFYPAPTYAERQAQWVKDNNVKEGTKVRVTRTFTDGEDGSHCWAHDDLVGMTGRVIVHGIGSHHLWVTMSDGNTRVVPYFALEIIKETIRPFNEDELNDLVGEVLINKQSGRKKLVTGKPQHGVNLDGHYINAKELLASFYRNTDKPCGVREEI